MEEITKVIDRLQRETEEASALAENAIRDLKATNETTKAIRDKLAEEMIKQSESISSISSDMNKLSAENARVRERAEKVKKDLAKIKSDGIQKPEDWISEEAKWIHHHSAPTGIHRKGKGIKDFICMDEIEKKIACSCDQIDKENSRTKINNAIEGLKEAIRCQRTGTGKTFQTDGKTFVNCHKTHGRKLYVIVKYASSLPGIGDEIQEIWRYLRDCSNIITRRDLVRISCILERYANRIEDGLLVEHNRAMFNSDLDFMSVWLRDDIVDDFSTEEEESIETLNSTSRAYGEATGARPKAGNQQGRKGHYTKEEEDRTFKEELKRRNELSNAREAQERRHKEKSEERRQKFKEWEQNHLNEVMAMIRAKSVMFKAKALEKMRNDHETRRRKDRSDRRAANHSKRQRNREKVKIPPPPGEDDGSSVTYYTSTTESSDTDSIPEINEPEL